MREFSLTPIEVEKLESNKDQLEVDYKVMIVGANKDEDEDMANWQWCSPALIKT